TTMAIERIRFMGWNYNLTQAERHKDTAFVPLWFLLDRNVGSFFGSDGLLHVVNRMTPVAVLRHMPSHDIEIQTPQAVRDLTHLARTDHAMIDPRDRADLRARAAEEHLIGQVK